MCVWDFFFFLPPLHLLSDASVQTHTTGGLKGWYGHVMGWKYCCWLLLLLLQPSRKQIQVTWPHIRTSLLPLADSSRALLRGSSAGPGDGLHLQGGRRFRRALFFSHFTKVVAWLRKHQRDKWFEVRCGNESLIEEIHPQLYLLLHWFQSVTGATRHEALFSNTKINIPLGSFPALRKLLNWS